MSVTERNEFVSADQLHRAGRGTENYEVKSPNRGWHNIRCDTAVEFETSRFGIPQKFRAIPDFVNLGRNLLFLRFFYFFSTLLLNFENICYQK